MTPEFWQSLLTAALAAGGAWAAVHAELRALWRAHQALERRIERMESKVLGG